MLLSHYGIAYYTTLYYNQLSARDRSLMRGDSPPRAAHGAADDEKRRHTRAPRQWSRCEPLRLRETGGAPRNLAPRTHFLVWIVKPSGCHCTDALGGKEYRRVPTPLRSTSPFSDPQISLATA